MPSLFDDIVEEFSQWRREIEERAIHTPIYAERHHPSDSASPPTVRIDTTEITPGQFSGSPTRVWIDQPLSLPSCTECDFRNVEVTFHYYGSVTSDCVGSISWDCTKTETSGFFPCGGGATPDVEIRDPFIGDSCTSCECASESHDVAARVHVAIATLGDNITVTPGSPPFLHWALCDGAAVGCNSCDAQYYGPGDGFPNYGPVITVDSWCAAIGNIYTFMDSIIIDQVYPDSCYDDCETHHTRDLTLSGTANFEVTITVT